MQANAKVTLFGKNKLKNFIKTLILLNIICFAANAQVAVQDDCFNCDNNYSKFIEMINNMENVTEETTKNEGSDFIDTGIGVLVHKECEGFFPAIKDIKKAVVDGVVKGMTCMSDMHQEMSDPDVFGRENVAFTSHIPRLVNLFDRSSWKKVSEPKVTSKNDNGESVELNLNNACRDYKRMSSSTDKYKLYGTSCKVDKNVHEGQPKIFCGEGQLMQALQADCKKADGTVSGLPECAIVTALASATGPQAKRPIYKNYKGKTRVYSYPAVIFHNKLQGSKKITKEMFQSFLFHEMFHNIGYSHDNHEHNDYANFCQFACFAGAHRDKFDSQRKFEDAVDDAFVRCSDPSYDSKNGATNHSIGRELLDELTSDFY